MAVDTEEITGTKKSEAPAPAPSHASRRGEAYESVIGMLLERACEMADAQDHAGSREKVGAAEAFKLTRFLTRRMWDFTITVKVDGKPTPPPKD